MGQAAAIEAVKTADQQSRAEHEGETVKKKKPNLKDETFNKYMSIILVMWSFDLL